ncbi:MAG TPA: sulfite exporter TauE/SafE family protein [Gaiellaceae bacterium]|nr:sulfite exporter TauE/SafE family protein [Gaiellaceae bacterium]
MTWQYIIAGGAIGILVGMTGMGGGSLMTPILIFVFGFDPTIAVGTDIFHGAIFKTVGGLRHHRLGTTQAQLSGWMLLGSAPASLGGVALATYFKHRFGDSATSVEGYVLGVALLIGGAGMLLKSLMRRRDFGDGVFRMRSRDKLAAIVIGLLGGFIVGLTSVGSGVFFGLTLLIVFPLRAHKVVGTDILHAAGLLWVAGIGHIAAGNVDMHAVAWLLIGSIPGVLAGSQWTVKIGDRPLRLLLAAVLFASGAKLAVPFGNFWLVPAGAFVLATAYAGFVTRNRVLSPA